MGIDTTKLGAMHEWMQWYVDQEILPCVETIVLDGTEVHCRGQSNAGNVPYAPPQPGSKALWSRRR